MALYININVLLVFQDYYTCMSIRIDISTVLFNFNYCALITRQESNCDNYWECMIVHTTMAVE